jgi:hypothetical protein
MQVRTPPAAPRTLNPAIPDALERVILRALAKDPADRYPTAFELQEDLELFMRESKLHALPGALGRYLEHLFGAKPYPWAKFYRQQPPPPPTSRSALFEAAPTTRRPLPESQTVSRAFDPNEMTTEPSRMVAEATVAADGQAASQLDHLVAPTAMNAPTYATQDDDVPLSEPVPAQPVARLRNRAVAIAMGIAAVATLWIVMPSRTEPTGVAENASAPETTTRSAAIAPAPISAPLALEPADRPSTAVEPAPYDPPSLELPALPSTPTAEEPEPVVLADNEERTSGSRPAPMDRNARIREAKRLIAEARGLVFGQPARAMALARKSVALHPTDDGYGLLGMTACRSGDARSARKAYSHLRGKKRDDLVRACADRGIEFTIDLEH